MKPNDKNANLQTSERPFRVMLIAGSERREYNCPGVDSKARMLMLKMSALLPQEWEIDYEDISNTYGREKIQSCNACVSTSMALCVWPCNCYEKDSHAEPDMMWNADMYARLDMADAWAIIGPVNWYGPTSNLKLMFDRLVCMNGGNPDEKLIDHKNPEKAMALEHSDLWKELMQNHLEGRTAGFFCYGDGGGDEMNENNVPKILRHKVYFDGSKEPFDDMRQAYAPLVWQCRYGGVQVPDNLWQYAESGLGEKYSDNQSEDVINNDSFMNSFYDWVQQFAEFVADKEKVQPGKYRAFGYEPPPHFWDEIKGGVRAFKLRLGITPNDSSPEVQKELDLNKDTTFFPKEYDGKRLRG